VKLWHDVIINQMIVEGWFQSDETFLVDSQTSSTDGCLGLFLLVGFLELLSKFFLLAIFSPFKFKELLLSLFLVIIPLFALVFKISNIFRVRVQMLYAELKHAI